MKVQDIEFKDIPIKDIRIVENHRTNIEQSHLDELMQSIKQHGLIQPIGVAPDGEKGFILRFGQRRFLACKKLGHTKINAMVSGETDKEKLLMENLTENMQRKDPSFSEYGRVIKKIEDDHGLSLKQVAVRLGLPIQKIKQIVSVYGALPEKYRKKVMFMERGGGRSENKGFIPATVAIKIVEMKKEHSLKDKDVDTLFKTVTEESLDKSDLNNVGNLMGSGMTAEQALNNAREYGVFTVDVVAKHSDVKRLMDENSILNRISFFKKVFYGEIPPLVKPSFVSTGLKAVKKTTVKLDTRPYQAMLKQLLKLARAKGLNDEQQAAINSTHKIDSKQWTIEQCQQIKELFDKHFSKK
jgi:ParB/RepB/Spo0J family partition protein